MAARKKRKTAKPVHNETASALVGVSTELLELILVKLTHRQGESETVPDSYALHR